MPNASAPAVYQGLLLRQLKHIFHNEETHENIRSLKLSGFEIDVWVPKYHLGFEFQDSYHYVTTWDVQDTQEIIKTKDKTKRALVQQHGITLVEVPCWWDSSIASLAASIYFQRPDLIKLGASNPISLNPPSRFFNIVDVPYIGEFMLASFLPNTRVLTIDEHSWWVGEKYDGIRCCWNPLDRNCYGRSGKYMDLPSNITGLLPSTFLDCEIWFGRGQFIYVYSIYKSSEKGHWDLLRMIAFDVPNKSLQNQPFEERYQQLFASIAPEREFIITAPRMLCTNEPTLRRHIQMIIDNSGEGVILQKVASAYEHGRTSSLIKLKAYLNDQEGLIIARGENNEVLVELPDGRRFTVPPQDVLVPPPLIGDVVTFSCDNFSRKELPDSPKIIRTRPDVLWEDVVLNSSMEKRHLNSNSIVFGDYTAKPAGYWSLKNMRIFMENFARERDLDPHLAATWYAIPAKEIDKTKGGSTIMTKLKGYSNSLQRLFPSIKFDQSLFIQSSWTSIESKRRFFENYAKANDFDPYDPNNWYKQSHRKVGAFKGGYAIVKQTQFHRALVSVFPNIGLEISKFPRTSRFHWRENRIKFLEKYASDNGFDPLDPECWYLQSRERILSVKGATTVVRYHESNVKTTLLDLFPNIGLERGQFKSFNLYNRRKYLERYADEHHFDPLIAENWYTQTRESLLAAKETASILPYHKHSIATTLTCLFPDAHLDPNRLHHLDTPPPSH